jgi:hypothetical protein
MNKKYTLGITLIALAIASVCVYAYNASETESMFSFKKISSFRNHKTDHGEKSHKGMNEFSNCLKGKCESQLTPNDKIVTNTPKFEQV